MGRACPPEKLYIKKFSRNGWKRHNKRVNKRKRDETELDKYITNLSSIELSVSEKKVLSKGLSFVPTVSSKTEATKQSFERFQRSNRLKFFFRDSGPQQVHPFRKKSTWDPPPASPHIEAYLRRIEAGVCTMPKRHYQYNLTRIERTALNSLSKNQDLIIKKADKGSGIVVEDRLGYIRDGEQHLADSCIYEKINLDPTESLTEAVDQLVRQLHGKGVIDTVTKDYLSFGTARVPRTQQLYFLKKIHKNPVAVRPIVSGCDGPTERVSELIDHILQPFVPEIKSYIRDSKQMIQTMEQTTVPQNSILATIDVKGLYLNIPHREGIEAVLNRVYHKNPESEEVPIPPESMADLLGLVLKHNYFQFHDSMYHQIQGTAMGTKMAPAYANLFMAEIEEALLAGYPEKPMLWKRYIDDIYCIWSGTRESFTAFMDYLNTAHPTIKFTYEVSEESIDFLDITTYKGERHRQTGKLDIKPYFKHTNKFQYLHYSSGHPRKTFPGLIKGELTRLLRACSDETTYVNTVEKMTRIFRDRGYPANLISRVADSVPFSHRTHAIEDKERDSCPYDTFFVIKHTADLDAEHLRKILKPDPSEEEMVPKPCLSLRRDKNLGDRIVRAKLKDCAAPQKSTEQMRLNMTPNLRGHSAGCGTWNCGCCRVMSRKQRAISSSNYKSFAVPSHTNCNSNNVIYLLECSKCTKANQYVGKTERTLAQRVAGHRAASKIKLNLPIYKHFSSRADHQFERDIRLTILEQTSRPQLDQREGHWIRTLDTITPKGLNSRFE